jgi:peptidoglycan/LPS O-acetylase OafA/YrhL
MNNYIKSLDGMRALAIMMVVVHHSSFLIQDGFFHDLSRFMGSGVDLFFIISGFLITNILINTKNNPRFFRNFYGRRFLRIIPLYYAILIFASFIIPLIHIESFKKFSDISLTPYWFFLSNYAIAAKGNFQHGLVDLSWSLSLEEQFYVFWSLCVYFFAEKHLRKIAILVLILCPILRYFAYTSGQSLVAIHIMTHTRIDTILMGSMLALFMRDNMVTTKNLLFTLALCFLIFFGLYALPFGVKLALGYSFLGGIYMSLVGLAIFASQNQNLNLSFLRKILENNLLVHIGLYSYGIYLLHNPIQKVLQIVYRPVLNLVPLNIAFHQFIFVLIVLAISSALAALSYHFYELKWLRLKKYL